jgi:hypothetical protein
VPRDSIMTQYLPKFVGTMWCRIVKVQVVAFRVTRCDHQKPRSSFPPIGRLTVTRPLNGPLGWIGSKRARYVRT